MSAVLAVAGDDPLPGDVAGVERLAAHFSRVAEASATHAGTVRAVGTVGWRGPAASAFEDVAAELAQLLDRVAERYGGFAATVRAYAGALESAQAQARAAVEAAREAQHRHGRAVAALEAERRELAVRVQAGDPDAWVRTAQLSHGSPAVHEAEQSLEAAHRRLRAAVEDRDEAAERACRSLTDAAEELSDPGFWSRLASTVSTWAGRVSAALGVAAVALAFVPGVGAALAAASLVFSAVALLADTFLLTQGRKTTADVLWSATGVVGGAAGKVLGTAATLGRSGALPAARASLGSSVAAMGAGGRLSTHLASAALQSGRDAARLAATVASPGRWRPGLSRLVRDPVLQGIRRSPGGLDGRLGSAGTAFLMHAHGMPQVLNGTRGVVLRQAGMGLDVATVSAGVHASFFRSSAPAAAPAPRLARASGRTTAAARSAGRAP